MMSQRNGGTSSSSAWPTQNLRSVSMDKSSRIRKFSGSNDSMIQSSAIHPTASMSMRSTSARRLSGSSAPIQRQPSRDDESDDDSANDETVERQNAISRAKGDLMQLGIELDDEIIERLQKNLKIEKIFNIAHQASKIVTKKANADRTSEAETLYRHVSNTQPQSPQKTAVNTQAQLKVVAGNHPIVSILNPKIAIPYDERDAVELLQKLENGRADIEPQHRPVLETAIEKFRLQYARHPDKFICRLLGQKVPTMASIEQAKNRQQAGTTTSGKSTTQVDNKEKDREINPNATMLSVKSATGRKVPAGDAANASEINTTAQPAQRQQEKEQQRQQNATHAQAIQRAAVQNAINEQIMEWVLQKRYLLQSDFFAMIQRVLPSHMQDYEEVAQILFNLLAETKRLQANSNKKKAVVDLWGFLTLLKVASDESRRSYDAKTSRLATEVEFWRRDNGKHVVLSNEKGPLVSNTTRKPGKISTKKFADYSQDPVKILIDPTQAPSLETFFPAKKNPDGRIFHNVSGPGLRVENKHVAELIGQQHHEHTSKANKGRQVLGCFAQEFTNVCDVPTALHSPKRAKTPQRIVFSDRAMQEEHSLPIAPSTELLDSRNVAFLLGQKELVNKQQKHNGNVGAARASSTNRFMREQYDTTTMASAFGRPETVPPPPPLDYHHHRSADIQPAVAGYASGKTQSRPMWMNSTTSLHWESHRPSVAAALGANTSYLQSNRMRTHGQ